MAPWAGRKGGWADGDRGGCASPGGVGRDAAALGRAARGWCPGLSPSRRCLRIRRSGPGRPSVSPFAPRRSFICLGSPGLRILSLPFFFPVCLSTSLLDPRAAFSPYRRWCFGKSCWASGSRRPAWVTCARGCKGRKPFPS